VSLYRVEVTRVLYVVADDEAAAEREALSAERNDEECWTDALEAESGRARYDDNWLGCIPYGGDRRATVGQLLMVKP
jgi:hypothetical protein